jgi:aminomethyltransferase
MPVQYEGIRQEHLAVRRSAGMFDVSHMGQIETGGPDAEGFLQHLLSNDVTRIPEGGAQYSVLCREDGGVLDDLFTYRLPRMSGRSGTNEGGEREAPRFLTVTNAANHERDHAWFAEHTEDFEVEVRDSHTDYAMLALQGPEARAILARRLDGEAPGRMRATTARVAGVKCLVCGTGYTGEDGVELLLPPEQAGAVWDALQAEGARPAGLGSRDTLRLEVCFHLYGNDLSEDRTPIEAGLGWCCKLDTGFVGSDALRGIEPSERLVPFVLTDRGIPRPGNPVRTDVGDGSVTSGTLSPCLDVGIGMAYVPVAAAEPGTRIAIDVRGKLRGAEVREKPLYRKD